MGFLSKLFGSDKTNSSEPKKQQEIKSAPKAPLFSNAPEHWGTLNSDLFIDSMEHPHQNAMMTNLNILGEINKRLEEISQTKVTAQYKNALHNCTEKYATSFCISLLLDEGIFELSGLVIDNGKRIPVMIYPLPVSPEEIHSIDLKLQAEGYEPLVWIARQKPSATVPVKSLPVIEVNKSFLSMNKDKQGIQNRSYKQYAMWWKSENQPSFVGTNLQKSIDLFMKSFDKYESYALGMFSYILGLKEEPTRTALPPEDEAIIEGPEGVEIIMSLSTEKGIRFHFPVLPEYEKYRDRFYKIIADWSVSFRKKINEKGFKEDNFTENSAYDWFSFLCRSIAENKDEVDRIGGIEN